MSIWETIEHSVESAASTVSNAAKSTWHATTEEATDVASAIEGAGTTMSSGLVEGAKNALKWSGKGAVIAYKSAVEAGLYVSQHLCDIAVGSALSAIFATLATEGSEESSLGVLVATCATSTIDRSAIATESRFFASIISGPIWALPCTNVDGKMTKGNLESIFSYVIERCCVEEPQMVVSTGGQYIVGALIACTTTLICEGALPGGYKQ